MEHPGLLPKHANLGAPSIWNLEQVQRLVAAPCVRRLQVNHNDFGGLAVKPTGILAIRLDTLETRFKENKHTVPPQAQLEGKDNITGAWNTAVAKEYPTRLSASLARSMISQLLLHTAAHHHNKVQFDQQLLHQFMPPLDPYLSDIADLGADFVDEAMLPVDRFCMAWAPPLIPQTYSYVDKHHIPPFYVYPPVEC